MWKDGLSWRRKNPAGRLIWLAILAWALASPAAAGDAPDARLTALPAAADLAADARLAGRDGVPVLLLFTRADCSWCERVRRQYLLPMAQEKTPRAVIREVHMDTSQPLLDFAGRRITSADFARAHKASFAPTLMFFDPAGQASAAPIVGFLTADFYGTYIERALDASRQHIAQLRTTPNAQASQAR